VEEYQNKISIKSWAEEDRPREKLSGQGRRALTDAELIAILIGSGSRTESAVELSKRILHHYDNDLNKLGKAGISELCKFKGIGEAKAISIIAALEIGRRRGDTEIKVGRSKKQQGWLQHYAPPPDGFKPRGILDNADRPVIKSNCQRAGK
jgi:DNA repair protein RadC